MPDVLHWIVKALPPAASNLTWAVLGTLVFAAGGAAFAWWKSRVGLKELRLPEGVQDHLKIEPVRFDDVGGPASPTGILDWRSRFVDLVGRDATLDELRRWGTLTKGRDFRIQLATGACGSGKTRLVAEVAKELQDTKRVLWTRLRRRFRSIGFATKAITTQLPAFLILDDQESVRGDIVKLLDSLAKHEDVRHPVRVLLLCRNESAASWREHIWKSPVLRKALEPDLFLAPLPEEDAVHLFLAALARLGVTEQEPEALCAEFKDWLKFEREWRALPLFVIAAAFARSKEKSLIGYTHQDVIRALSDRERERIQKSVAGNDKLQPEIAERLIALAALRGSLTFDDLRRLARADLEIGLPDANDITGEVKQSGILWRGDAKKGIALVAPEPQLLANIFAWQVLTEPEIVSQAPEAIYHAIAEPQIGEETRIALRLSRFFYDGALTFDGLRPLPEIEWDRVLGQDGATRAERAQDLDYLLEASVLYIEPLTIAILKTRVEGAANNLERAELLNTLGNALWTLGGRENGTARLEEAVEAHRAALQERTRERVPLEGAGMQNNLGNALWTLGGRENGTARLEEAVEAYRAALRECTRERAPLQWAMTQNNLGNALSTLGGRESGTARLEEAVAAYRAALQEHTRECTPLEWAATQNNLGAALSTLGERENGTARLEEAVEAYRAALQERTRERVPLEWAMTQNNLGNALSTLGEREKSTARLEEAVEAYRAALQERTRERVPLQWAMTQNNLGTALETLGGRENGTARLEEAVEAHRAALQERTRERVPLEWAATQNNLGAALSTLGKRENGTARLEEAVVAYHAALQEYTRELVPLRWAMTQNNLGTALSTLGKRENGIARLEEAVEAYRASLQEGTRERVPLDWAGTQYNLGIALQTLGGRENGIARLEEAVEAYHAALQEYTRELVPLQWGATQNVLGIVLWTLGGRENDTARLEEAVEAYRAALQEFTRELVPLQWASTQNILGIALESLGDLRATRGATQIACQAYDEALTVFGLLHVSSHAQEGEENAKRVHEKFRDLGCGARAARS